jgi:signal transduction histidine kinase
VRRLTIRARITLGSVLVAFVLLSGALLVVRSQVAEVLTRSDAELAASDLAGFVADITADTEPEVDDPGTGVLIAVRSPGGSVEIDTLPHDVREIVDARPEGDDEFRMTDDEGRGFVVVGRVVDTEAGGWALWAARSTSASELALEGLDRLLLAGGALLLAGFAAASWLLATLALRPVSRMRTRAETLGAALDGELPIGRADDELAALARTLNDLLARVRASSAREKQMVSDAAHELRTPLAALRTQLELAHDDFGDAAALERHVRSAESSASRLSSLAGNLLELSRLESEAGRAPRTASAEELVTEFLGAVDRARLLAVSSSTEVAFDLTVEARSDRFALDPASFGRLVDNLLSNAVTSAAGGTVEARLAQGAGELSLVVSDDGPGMPAEFLPHAFERFSRPDDARTSQSGGSGLGLALVRAIASAAGGAAEVTNTASGFAAAVWLPKM